MILVEWTFLFLLKKFKSSIRLFKGARHFVIFRS